MYERGGGGTVAGSLSRSRNERQSIGVLEIKRLTKGLLFVLCHREE